MTEWLLPAAGANPLSHVLPHPFVVAEDGTWMWDTTMGNLVLSALIMITLGVWIAGKIATGPAEQGHDRYVTRNSFAHMVEVICVYLREQTVRPMLGDRTDRFMPFLWTLFFFILVNNLLGLIPILDILHLINPAWREAGIAPAGGTATQNLAVTGALALVSFVVINVSGVLQLGIGGYLKHLTGGAPWFIWPILVPVEVMGTFVKPIALAIRLFANMTAGHTLLATLFMFVGLVINQSLLLSGPVTLVSALAAVPIYFLEIFVAFLQAFIFMFLTTVFVAQLSHHDEDHAHASPEPTVSGA